jgi:hypothetical protein
VSYFRRHAGADEAPVPTVTSSEAPSARWVEQALTGISPGALYESALWPAPPMRDFHPLGLLRPSPVLDLLKGTTLSKQTHPTTVFLRRPSSGNAKRRTHRIEHRDYIQTGGVGTPHDLEIDPVSLRRTGRAILMASSATGSAQCRLVRPAPFRSFGNELLQVSCTHIHSASRCYSSGDLLRDPVSRRRISVPSE